MMMTRWRSRLHRDRPSLRPRDLARGGAGELGNGGGDLARRADATRRGASAGVRRRAFRPGDGPKMDGPKHLFMTPGMLFTAELVFFGVE